VDHAVIAVTTSSIMALPTRIVVISEDGETKIREFYRVADQNHSPLLWICLAMEAEAGIRYGLK